MSKTIHYLKWLGNIILGLGSILALNESDTFVPNFIGIACFYLLIFFNRKKQYD